jgi:hypothetical protein
MEASLQITVSKVIAQGPRVVRTLLEKDNVLRLESKVRIALEELLRLAPCRPASHNIPRDDNRLGPARFLLRDLLQARDAFGLVLE